MVQHNKVIVNGSFGGGDEVWSIGINFCGAGNVPGNLITGQEDLNAWAAAIHDTIDDDLSLVRNLLSVNGGFSSTVTQYYNAENELLTQSVPAANYIAGLGAPNCPLQTAVCVSLLTGRPGASYRGRVYLPGPGAAIDADFRLTTPTDPGDLAEQFAEWLGIIQEKSQLYGDAVACVFSPTRDVLTPVSTIRVGDVADTQRRRRDNLTENYSTVPIGTP